MDYYDLDREQEQYQRNQNAAQEWYDMGESDAYDYKDSQYPNNSAYQQGYEAAIRKRDREPMHATCYMVKTENTYRLNKIEVDMPDTPEQRQQKIISYLQPKVISSADSELIDQIQLLICDLSPLAKQKLAIQLLHEVELLLYSQE